jgi:hypothetical protein
VGHYEAGLLCVDRQNGKVRRGVVAVNREGRNGVGLIEVGRNGVGLIEVGRSVAGRRDAIRA